MGLHKVGGQTVTGLFASVEYYISVKNRWHIALSYMKQGYLIILAIKNGDTHTFKEYEGDFLSHHNVQVYIMT